MNPVKSEAIRFLKASIADYCRRLEGLRAARRDVSSIADIPNQAHEREQLNALIDDARRLLVQLEGR